MPTYVLLTGAKENVGDHLIVKRAKQLLKKHVPNIQFIELHRWEPLDQHLSEVNVSQGIILCRGPAYQPHFYPGIYPLVGELGKVKVPIIPFGLGWKGFPGDERTVREYRFTESSIKLLERVHRDCQFTSCRDYLTKWVLERHGFSNVIMTGDPAWYDPLHLESPFVFPSEIRNIVISMPANRIYYKQSLSLVTRIKDIFPQARILCTFHHGWVPTEYDASSAFAHEQASLKEELIKSGFEAVSLASNLKLMEDEYSKADLHVGYRLHAHLYFLSQRKPSFLLEEDGRGRGASEALGWRGIQAWSRSALDDRLGKLSTRPVRSVARRVFNIKVRARQEAVDEVLALIRDEVNDGFPHLQGLHQVFEHYYHKALVPFLQAIPKRDYK